MKESEHVPCRDHKSWNSCDSNGFGILFSQFYWTNDNDGMFCSWKYGTVMN